VELSAVVVVPARDEQERIGSCLGALAAQTVEPRRFELLLVDDASRDRTAEVAQRAARNLGLRLTVLAGPGRGTGPARRLGLDVGAQRLIEAGSPRGLLATTDADSLPAPDWLERQLAHLAAGAQVVAGLIELAPDEAADLPETVHNRRAADARERLRLLGGISRETAHHHFAGASLGLTPELYRRVGGLDGSIALEDEAFSVRLAEHHIPILRAADVRVRTSARSDGRARRGLSVDLAVSEWLDRRRFRAEEFPPSALAARKPAGMRIAVAIPTRECAETVGGVLNKTVAPLHLRGIVDEVVVIDAGSQDGTPEQAASIGRWVQVVQQDDLLGAFGPALGKGDAMWRAVHHLRSDIICFLDGDTTDPDPRHLQGLIGPLLSDAGIHLVKGAFERPLLAGDRQLPHEGGRVTELMARPLLNLHEPLLAGFSQPLAGELAGRRELLESIPFPVGYGIEIAMLIDSLRRVGLCGLAETHLGTRQNRHQPLRALGEMSYALLAAVERRIEGQRSPAHGHYMRPWEDGKIVRVPILERPPLSRLRGQRLPRDEASNVA
jgi:glucosyl-3-phosphoglycerate synthase